VESKECRMCGNEATADCEPTIIVVASARIVASDTLTFRVLVGFIGSPTSLQYFLGRSGTQLVPQSLPTVEKYLSEEVRYPWVRRQDEIGFGFSCFFLL
jgi:hypothetical protein